MYVCTEVIFIKKGLSYNIYEFIVISDRYTSFTIIFKIIRSILRIKMHELEWLGFTCGHWKTSLHWGSFEAPAMKIYLGYKG